MEFEQFILCFDVESLDGVAFQAAAWMCLFMSVTAFSNYIGVLSDMLQQILSVKVFRNWSQFVFLLCSIGVFFFKVKLMSSVTIIGE